MGARLALCLSVFLFTGGIALNAQKNGSTFVPDQEIRIRDLPATTAVSHDLSRVLAAALEIALRDKAVCCGRDSALEDALLADPRSLKELSGRIQGRHLLSDGRPINITSNFVPRTSVRPEFIIGTLREQRIALLEWKSHFYVVYGVIYSETIDNNEISSDSIHKILLLDPRYADAKREVVFDRDVDDWEKVEGFLVTVVSQ